MKKWIKYLISPFAFGITYILIEYLFSKNIDWKMVIVATIMYTVLYIVIDYICNKTRTKK